MWHRRIKKRNDFMFRSFSQYYQLAKKTATNKSYSCINREVVATTKTVSTIWFGAQIFAYCKCDTIEIRYNRTECVVQSHQVPLSCIGNKVYIVLCLQCHRMIQKCVSNSEHFKFGTFHIRYISNSEFECFELVFIEWHCELFSSFAIKPNFTKQNSPT